MSDLNASADAALRYIGHGFAVFPLRARDKRPLTEHGVKDATKDGGKALRWWGAAHRDANVAIATGAPSGVVVLDVDGSEGEQSLARLLRENGVTMPRTPTASTGKGLHVYFRHPGGAIKNGVAILPGLDVRADGGYVAAPPSVHPSGDRYKWLLDLDGAKLAAVPEWLMTAVFQPAERERTAAPSDGPVPSGRRNDTMYRDACALRGRGMTEASILAAIRADNGVRYIPPLEDDEVVRIAQNAALQPVNVEQIKDEEWRARQQEKAEDGKPRLKLLVTVSNPKTWHLVVNGDTVKVSTDVLKSWAKIESAFMEQLMMSPSWEPKDKGEWKTTLRDLLPSAEKIDAPEELTTTGRVAAFARSFCQQYNRSKTALVRNGVWYDAEHRRFVFKTGDLINMIERDFGLSKGLTAREANEVLRESFGATSTKVRVGKAAGIRVLTVDVDRLGLDPDAETGEDGEDEEVLR